MKHIRRVCLLVFLFALAAFASSAEAQTSILNELFARALSRHVTEGGIQFAGFKDDEDFQAYLKALADFNHASLKIVSKPDATPEEKKEDAQYEHRRTVAFWINAHNALAIKAIADRYNGKMKSVREIRGFYRDPIASVAGRPRSLTEIEDAVLFKELNEPRAIFLLYRGMIGGPNLPPSPITAIDLESSLFDGMKRFFDNPENYRVDSLGKIVWLPDFLKSVEREVGGPKPTLRLVSPYFKRARENRFIESEEVSLKYFPTDGSLMPPPPPKKKEAKS
jgi:uncharacterized protein DUF547